MTKYIKIDTCIECPFSISLDEYSTKCIRLLKDNVKHIILNDNTILPNCPIEDIGLSVILDKKRLHDDFVNFGMYHKSDIMLSKIEIGRMINATIINN